MPSAVIRGIGAALPPPVDQRAMWDDHFRDRLGGDRTAERIFAGSGVRRRHAVADPRVEDVAEWSTAARMRRYGEAAPALAHRAVRAALADADLDAADVGLLAVASCTGYGTPGVDIELAGSLPLDPRARRLLVGHMGCYAALPGLDSVGDYVRANSRPAVLLCLELTSLHAQPATTDPEQVVCHALFGDAAVALVLLPDDGPGLRVADTAWRTHPGTSDHMTWQVTDLGFRMGLSRRVPDVLGDEVELLAKDLLDPHGLTPADVDRWAVHPGGPRILDTVERGLGLAPDALAVSRHVLAEYGNCSSATVPLILGQLAPSPGETVVAMAFGPGLTLSGALLVAQD
ncbi:type III polyketide synthase [Actinokineospora soli]|uniref:Type III polyketide synthase n=1 Tax=Actinokineospora soli TaxID=1048753 RepID=A0ABW2TP56_9PSEU